MPPFGVTASASRARETTIGGKGMEDTNHVNTAIHAFVKLPDWILVARRVQVANPPAQNPANTTV